ncbi:uncharacterized protein LOC142588494 [Dermacentor variabilis]|uniref:uncharacterized protein LOC142588494 n=1 Tax=Dermacentor variabilis TaxID=34621 RepID=UPI003F5C4AFB
MRLARSNVRLLVLIAFYFLFIVIGASIFSTIEAPHENSVIRKLRAKRAAFLEEHPCVKDYACAFNNGLATASCAMGGQMLIDQRHGEPGYGWSDDVRRCTPDAGFSATWGP